ncbi:hypothetical protein HK104_008911 [Borealophlyctis nickersoniae]|nr:hypothetical protein HK104_008911 [Borealophlyctis nickersoniae]
MVKKRFIDPQNAVRYQVVHRSQRDPALADAQASKLVLKAVPPSRNLVKKGKYDLDQIPDDDDYREAEGVSDEEFWDEEGLEDEEEGSQAEVDESDEHAPKGKVLGKGEEKSKRDAEGVVIKEDATMHGIFFSDHDSYNYLQHLKPIGEDPSAVFVEAKGKKDKKDKEGIRILDDTASQTTSVAGRRRVNFSIPAEALPSAFEEKVGMLNRSSDVATADPKVREVLYALDDEAYVEEELDDDFFAALNADEVPEGVEDVDEEGSDEEGDEEWYREFKKYKKQQLQPPSDDDQDSSGSDITPRAPRTARTATTSFSMSSSAMFRNDTLTLLDDRFDAVLEEYSDTEIGELDPDDPSVRGGNLITKNRLENLFDEFLEDSRVMGRKQRVIRGDEPLKQMDTIRNTLKEDARDIVLKHEHVLDDQSADAGENDARELVRPEMKVHDTWDVETVLSTYSNAYNHPKLIQEVGKGVGKIRLKGKMKMPVMEKDHDQSDSEEESGGKGEHETSKVNRGVARMKGESKEEKKARKEAVKAERRNRRSEKKATKQAFKDEQSRQAKLVRNIALQERSKHLA